MALLEWRADFEIGVPDVDAEHRELVELINELPGALAEDSIAAALRDILLSVAEEEAVRAVVVTGSGRFFSAGADLKASRPSSEDTTRLLIEEYGPGLRAIAEMPKPVIAALNGPAVGIGLAYALASDLIVMAESAYLQAPFIKIGLLPDGGLSWMLPRALGYQRAFEFVAEAQTIAADRALELGLVNRLVADERVLSEAEDWAESLCARAPLGLAAAKQALRLNAGSSYAESLVTEARLQGPLVASDDCAEGFKAFLEQRKPQFRGS